jgi:hypothetical protein
VPHCSGLSPRWGVPQRHFPSPWSVDEADSKVDRRSFIVRDANRKALAYVYFEDEAGRPIALGAEPQTSDAENALT